MATSKFAKAFAKVSEDAWDKAKTAEATGARNLHLPVGSYIANLEWTINEIKKGDNKGYHVLVCKFTVTEGAYKGHSFDKAFYLAPGDYLEQTLQRLTKWLKSCYPEDAEEISAMNAVGIAEYLESDVIGNDILAEIEIDEYSTEVVDKKTGKKVTKEGLYWQPLSPVDTDDEDEDDKDEDDEDEEAGEESEDEPEEEGSDDDDNEDEDESEDDSEDEDPEVEIQAGDVVLWKKPRARKMSEYDVIRVNKNGSLTLKGEDGKTYKSVPQDEASLVEVDE